VVESAWVASLRLAELLNCRGDWQETPGPGGATSSGFSALYGLDPEGERRSSTMQDLANITRLVNGLNHKRVVF